MHQITALFVTLWFEILAIMLYIIHPILGTILHIIIPPFIPTSLVAASAIANLYIAWPKVVRRYKESRITQNILLGILWALWKLFLIIGYVIMIVVQILTFRFKLIQLTKEFYGDFKWWGKKDE